MERLQLGARRFGGAILAATRFLVVYPFIAPSQTNRFAHGVLKLQDELTYQNGLIPMKPLWELFPGVTEIDIALGRLFPTEGSSVLPEELMAICSIVRLERPNRVFEIGTSLGVSAYNIALNMPEDSELYTLDLPPVSDKQAITVQYPVTISDRKMIFADRTEPRFLNTGVSMRIHRLHGDSATFDFTPYIDTCDLVFVDGSHSAEYVRVDTETAFRIVRPGGLVIWHDFTDGYFWPEVARHLAKLAEKHAITRISNTSLAVCRAK